MRDKKISSLLLLLFLILTLLPTTAFAATYYLAPAPTGNDANNGTSPTTPKKSFSQYFNTSKPLQPGDTVVLLDGTYTEATTGLPRINCTSGGSANNGP